jgi:hypothetical protein
VLNCDVERKALLNKKKELESDSAEGDAAKIGV